MGFPGSGKREKFPVKHQWRNPDLEVKEGRGGGEGGSLFCLPCWLFFSSVIISLLPKLREAGPGRTLGLLMF